MNKLLLTGFLLSATVPSALAQSYWNPDLKASSLDAIQFTALDANADGSTWYPTTTALTFRNVDGQSGNNETRYPIYIDNKENDDWLFTPGILLEAGKTYKVRIEGCKPNFAAVNGGIGIMLGAQRNPESMTTTLLNSEDFILGEMGGNSLWNFSFEVSVPASGDYFIGFHCTGKAGQKIGICAIDIAQGIGVTTPTAVSDLTLTPAADGTKKVAISFTAPTTAKDGTELTSLSKIEVRRGSDLVKILDSPAPEPGVEYTVEDIVAVSGEYTYSVQAFAGTGAGDLAYATTFVGINVPSPAVNVKAVNTGNLSAKVTWEPAPSDKDGYPIAPELITYDVYRTPLYSSERTLVASDVNGLSCDDTLTADADEQQFYTYSVEAKTTAGNASSTNANVVPMGTPYAVPYIESFPNGTSTYIFSSEATVGNNYWSRSRNFDDVFSIDNDNGMAYLNGQIGGAATLYSGLIDIADTPSPTLNFYTYNIVPADPTDNTLQVTVTATDGTTKTFDEYAPGLGWTKTIYRLDEFAGKTVKLAFNGHRNNSTELHLDAVTISTIFRHDLKLSMLTVPAEIRTSEPFDIKVDIVNAGTEVSGKYTVELYCNGEKVDEQSGDSLTPGAFHNVVFTRTHTILDSEEAVYTATVAYDSDENTADNDSEPITAKVRKNSYPVVTDLDGTTVGNTVTLTWSEPDTDKAQPYEITDDFESYAPWANTDLGDWTLVDLDKAQIGGFSNSEGEVTMPGIPNYSEQSWWIFDNTHENFNNGSFATSSGHQFLASMYSGFKGTGQTAQNDDWAISPELYGGPQTISLQARSYSMDESRYEDIELLYSTGSTDPADFVSVVKYETIPSDFATYTADLPDGAKHFAIRNNNKDRFMLIVDDVTYIPVGEPAAFSINGYNVYRDGVRINESPVEECEYTDSDLDQIEHTYCVTVIYSAGESQLSNAYESKLSGIENVAADSEAPAEYYNLQGIRVNTLTPGQPYIVRRGANAKKIYVK